MKTKMNDSFCKQRDGRQHQKMYILSTAHLRNLKKALKGQIRNSLQAVQISEVWLEPSNTHCKGPTDNWIPKQQSEERSRRKHLLLRGAERAFQSQEKDIPVRYKKLQMQRELHRA